MAIHWYIAAQVAECNIHSGDLMAAVDFKR